MLYDRLVVQKSHLSLVVSGGPSLFADYCTYLVAYTDGICTDTNSAPDTMLGEVRGSNSRSVCHFLLIIYSVLCFYIKLQGQNCELSSFTAGVWPRHQCAQDLYKVLRPKEMVVISTGVSTTLQRYSLDSECQYKRKFYVSKMLYIILFLQHQVAFF